MHDRFNRQLSWVDLEELFCIFCNVKKVVIEVALENFLLLVVQLVLLFVVLCVTLVVLADGCRRLVIFLAINGVAQHV